MSRDVACERFSGPLIVGLQEFHDGRPPKSLSRRSLATTAAWAVPAAAVSIGAPAVTASPSDFTTTAGLYVELTSPNGNAESPVESFGIANPPNATGDYDWNDSARTRTVQSRPTQSGWNGGMVFNVEGYTTPGGTSGPGNALGGSGFWLSPPQDANGNFRGTTTLKAGAVFTLDFKYRHSGQVPTVWESGYPRVEPNYTANNRLLMSADGKTPIQPPDPYGWGTTP